MRWLSLLALLLAPLAAEPAAYLTADGEIGAGPALAELLRAGGHEPVDLGPAIARGELPLTTRVIVLGSFTTTPAVQAVLAAHRDALATWLRGGGVVVELCQADQDEKALGWLPPGLVVVRDDPDYGAITWTRADHPIATTPNRLEPGDLLGWRYRNWSIAWEAMTGWAGFEVIAATGNRGEAGALIEAEEGRGRILVSAIPADTLSARGEGNTPAQAKRLFTNLMAYVDQVLAGNGVALHPTPRLAAVTGPQVPSLRLGVLAGPARVLPAALSDLRVGFRLLKVDDALTGLDAVLIDAGAAETLPAAAGDRLRTFVEQGGVVVQLAQRQETQPAWLPESLRAHRGAFAGDVLVPAVDDHPLFHRPNPLPPLRRAGWRQPPFLARTPFDAELGWGVLARYGGETSPAAILERGVGRGRVLLVAADPGTAAVPGGAGDPARALLANLIEAVWLIRRGLPLTPPVALRDRPQMRIGRQPDGSVLVATEQLIVPAGRQVEFPGRPSDLLVLDDHTLAVADLGFLRLIDLREGEVTQSVGVPGRHGYHGLVATRDGRTLYTTTAAGRVQEWRRGVNGALTVGRSLVVPGTKPVPVGLALSADERTLFVAASRSNALVALDRVGNAPPRPVDVGVAPYAVLRVGGKLYVSNWGGRRPRPGERTALSSGTPVLVEERTIASSGTVTVLDERTLAVRRELEVGLLPSGLAASADGRRVLVANGNSDTVSVIDTATDAVVETIPVKPTAALPYGSGVNALAVSPDGRTLYVANGTNNAVAVVALGQVAGGEGASRVLGFIPTGWFPGALALSADGERLYVANTKGVGSLAEGLRHTSGQHQGSVSLIPRPRPAELAAMTEQVGRNNQLAAALQGLEPPRPGVAPRALPERHGEPSLLKHVVYIIRENRTYDQVLGDLPQGNGDPELVHFGRAVTPNAHALAETFTLLDNFNCSGVVSADGHQWTDEGYVTGYLEKMFGGFTRSYPYEGDDPLAYSGGGFIWDNALAHGKSFRDYGEMVHARIKATGTRRASFRNLYDDFTDNGVMDDFEIRAEPEIKALAEHLCETSIGFPGTVPDIYRADVFLRELKRFEQTGELPNLCILLLPCDHTAGTTPGMPVPRAAVADNDLALGRIVEGLSHSKFWPETAIFVTEDDPQAGLDHVDGHRTVGFAISPYTPRGRVDSTNYTQIGMLKTIELILGLPPMNQLDLTARPMRGCFGDQPDLTPYVARPNQVPLDELNPPLTALSGPAREWALASLRQPLDEVDEADEDTLNRILWHAVKGYDRPYPSRYAAKDED